MAKYSRKNFSVTLRHNRKTRKKGAKSRFSTSGRMIAFIAIAVIGLVSLGISLADSSTSGTDPTTPDTLGLSPPAVGTSQTPFKLCLHYNHQYCINGAGAGYAVYVITGGEKFYAYRPQAGARVTSTWPFNIGLGLNDKYEGDYVYIFCVYNITNHCLENDTSSQLVYTANVSSLPGPQGEFVFHNTGAGAYLVNVGETNYRNNGNSYGMALAGIGDNVYDYYIHLSGYYTRWWYIQ